MKILYVAKHNSGDNDDEGAITYCLEQLGHEVIRVQEKPKLRQPNLRHTHQLNQLKADLCLFHKWPSASEISQITCKKVFWYFDLVHSDDPLLAERSLVRVKWFREVMPHVDLAFMTDGQWIINQRDEGFEDHKYRWLMQGADERYITKMERQPNTSQPPILFTGTPNHGSERVAQIELLKSHYKDRFQVLGGDSPRLRKHQHELAQIIANAKIVIAPIGPVGDFYWSNRIYLTLGFGGFLLHPTCTGIPSINREYPYISGIDYVSYDGTEHLIELIDKYLVDDVGRQSVQDSGFETTRAGHLYKHRVIKLLKHCKEIGLV